MKILMLHQFFSTNHSVRNNRFFELGCRLVSQGHQVTVITGNAGLKLPLGNRKIGLLQTSGMAVVALNLTYDYRMKPFKKARLQMAYARLASHQGRRLPRPDLICAVSPPLATTLPAVSLSRFHGAPLVLNLEELWPEAAEQRGTLRNQTLIALARRVEAKACTHAFRIFAFDRSTAEAIKDVVNVQKKVLLVRDLESHWQQFETVLREATGEAAGEIGKTGG
jgi:colanic acid biosynthesis glycosyl transferase WcaI